MAREHSRLVHLAAAVVGAPHPRVLRPIRRRDGGRGGDARRQLRAARPLGHRPRGGRSANRGDGEVPRTRVHARAGRGRSRHVVLLGAVPFQRLRLAGRVPGPRGVLPDVSARDRARHLVLLGRADGHDGHEADRQGAVQAGVPARDGARRARAEDEQVSRERHRPASRDRGHIASGAEQDVGGWQLGRERDQEGGAGAGAGLPGWHSPVRHRRDAIRARRVHRAREGHQPRRLARRRVSALVQQDVERDPVRDDEPRRGVRAPGDAADVRRRPPPPRVAVGAEPVQSRGEGHGGGDGGVRLQRRDHRGVRVLAVRRLRRVHRARQARRERRRREREEGDEGHAVDVPRRRAAAVASVHAVRHRGAVAAAPEKESGERAVHHDRGLPRARAGARRRRRRGTDGDRAGDGEGDAVASRGV
mmetsp:Transcript_5126/g.18345  ORF Transcript_5126/g.18345 Transcript_5126/m.18345 type:complete len:419 (-) Transcript_5126:498-1754(-)